MGIAVSLAKDLFVPLTVATGLLAFLSVATLVAAFKVRRERLIAMPIPAYKLDDSEIVLEVLSDDGASAKIRHRERIRCLQDHFIAVRRTYYGDWETPQLADLKCSSPAHALVADCYPEGYGTQYLISLRHVYNSGEAFDHEVELFVKNGFCGEREEYFGWDVYVPTDRMLIKVVLPRGKQLLPDSVRCRVGHQRSRYASTRFPQRGWLSLRTAGSR